MAALTISSVGGPGPRTLTPNTLTASDTFTYEPGDIMILRNATGGALTPNFDGADSGVVGVDGWGVLNPAPGYTTPSIPAGAERVIFLDTIRFFLVGTVTVTGGTGMICSILRR